MGRYGVPFESIDLTIEGCDSWEQAEEQINIEHQKLYDLFSPHLKTKIDWLDGKVKLSLTEDREREELKKSLNKLPF